MAKKGGLGRGLDILFQDTGAGGGDEGVSTLRLAEIEPDKNQPRKAFDDTALSELAASITAVSYTHLDVYKRQELQYDGISV